MKKKKVIAHLKGDIKNFEHEAKEDRSLIKELHKKPAPKRRKVTKAKAKIKTVMREFKDKKLHSGSKKGPLVKNPKQAIAIAISESKRRK